MLNMHSIANRYVGRTELNFNVRETLLIGELTKGGYWLFSKIAFQGKQGNSLNLINDIVSK